MANEFYVTIEGMRTGRFHGESQKQPNKITGLEFFYEVISPRDPATGQATGKRQHKPITITKEWGAASPQIFQSLVDNENLKSVLFEFVQVATDGSQKVSHTIRLTGARVIAFRQYIGNVENFVYDSTSDVHKLENVSFSFRTIEISNVEGQTTAIDDPFDIA